MGSATVLPPCRHLWPVGFGFRPTEEELFYFLKIKMLGHDSLVPYVHELHLYNYDPWELPKLSVLESDNHEWFFFQLQQHHGSKTKRTTTTGFWKPTGDERKIKARETNTVIGTRKILVFHQGKSSNAVRTPWIIHEYHLHDDPNIANQMSYVICRLKENAQEICDEGDPNTCVASRLKRKYTDTAIQEEVFTETQSNGPSLHPQPVNDFDGGATENAVNFLDRVKAFLFEDEKFDGVTSKLQSPRCFEPEPAPMNFQPSNAYDGEVNRQFPHPGASENELSLTELLSGFVEDEKCEEVTSNSYNKAYLDGMVYELQGGFSSDTDNDATLCWQNNRTSPSCTATIKESRRSPLIVKHVKYEEEKDNCRLNKVQGNSSPKCGISVDSVKCDHETETFNQRKMNEIVDYGSVPKTKRVYSKREVGREIVSQDKVKEDEKAAKYSMSCYGSAAENRRFLYIITTKCINHKSSVPLTYVAKAIVGIIMFAMCLQHLLLCADWS